MQAFDEGKFYLDFQTFWNFFFFFRNNSKSSSEKQSLYCSVWLLVIINMAYGLDFCSLMCYLGLLACVLKSVVSDSLPPHGLQPTRFLCPWNCPGKNTGVGYPFLFQGIFPTQGLNPSLLRVLHWQADSLPLTLLGSPVPGVAELLNS